jgi:hypothetical protein
MKRLNKVVIVSISIVVIALAASQLFHINPDLEKEYKVYQKIKAGMTVDEVEELLGKQQMTKKYKDPTNPSIIEMRVYDIYTPKSKGTFDFNTYIYVYFNEDEKVVRISIDD